MKCAEPRRIAGLEGLEGVFQLPCPALVAYTRRRLLESLQVFDRMTEAATQIACFDQPWPVAGNIQDHRPVLCTSVPVPNTRLPHVLGLSRGTFQDRIEDLVVLVCLFRHRTLQVPIGIGMSEEIRLELGVLLANTSLGLSLKPSSNPSSK